MPQRSILFTSSLTSTFILDDLALLRKHYSVESLHTQGAGALLRILAGVVRNDLTFTWFASVYAFFVVAFARLCGKPSYIVLGGVDVMPVKGLAYGPWRSPGKRMLVAWAIRHADKILPVDEALRRSAMRMADYDGTNALVIPTGYDGTRWRPGRAKVRSVLCVAGCETRARLLVKGVDILFALARALPGERFILVGSAPRVLGLLGEPIPPNMTVKPPVSQEELLAFYQEATVYVQPSRSEGLPNAVCEAMLCGCIPVGTDVGGMASAIGECGYCVPPGEPAKLVQAVCQALGEHGDRWQRARERIRTLFPLERRETALRQLLTEAES